MMQNLKPQRMNENFAEGRIQMKSTLLLIDNDTNALCMHLHNMCQFSNKTWLTNEIGLNVYKQKKNILNLTSVLLLTYPCSF